MFPDTQSVFTRLVASHEPVDGPLTTQCWEWQLGCCNKHYGFIYIYDEASKKSKSNRAHIVSWTLANGRKPHEGMTLDHVCRNTRCIRPSHLDEVSRVENTVRGNRARR